MPLNLRKIWKHTKNVAADYEFSEAEKLEFSDIDDSEKLPQPSSKYIQVYHENFVDVAEKLVGSGYSPLLVINAIRTEPYSGLEGAIESREYDLFRKSNLHLSMVDSVYPIDHREAVYVPKFTVFKDSDYLKRRSPFALSAIAVCPVNSPEIISISDGTGSPAETYHSDSEKKLMEDKVAAIFDFAESREFDCLLIDNFGGGQFRNPVSDVVKMFAANIESHNIPYVFFCVSEKKVASKDPEFMRYHQAIPRG